MIKHRDTIIHNEAEMLAFGGKLANQHKPPTVIYLQGELGAGKTTLVRGYLQGLGYKGIVKSPTYTLVEPYQFNDFTVYHFDLYRIQQAEELYSLGIEDYFNDDTLCLIEWPERGLGTLPLPTVTYQITIEQEQRIITKLAV